MENSFLVIFDEIWLMTLYYSTVSLARFLSKLKNSKKNPILIGISLNFLHNISTCICIRKIIKMENSLLIIFDKINWAKSLYYNTGSLAKFHQKLHKENSPFLLHCLIHMFLFCAASLS